MKLQLLGTHTTVFYKHFEEHMPVQVYSRQRIYSNFIVISFSIRQQTADESNQTFIRHDDTVLLPERMQPEHKPTVAFVIKTQPKNLDS